VGFHQVVRQGVSHIWIPQRGFPASGPPNRKWWYPNGGPPRGSHRGIPHRCLQVGIPREVLLGTVPQGGHLGWSIIGGPPVGVIPVRSPREVSQKKGPQELYTRGVSRGGPRVWYHGGFPGCDHQAGIPQWWSSRYCPGGGVPQAGSAWGSPRVGRSKGIPQVAPPGDFPHDGPTGGFPQGVSPMEGPICGMSQVGSQGGSSSVGPQR
jgi:hypothetical protein